MALLTFYGDNNTTATLLGHITVLQYVDVAYCYRWSSVVCLSVCWSVMVVSPAETAEPIETPFWVWSLVGPGNRAIDGGPEPTWEGAILRERGGPL